MGKVVRKISALSFVYVVKVGVTDLTVISYKLEDHLVI